MGTFALAAILITSLSGHGSGSIAALPQADSSTALGSNFANEFTLPQSLIVPNDAEGAQLFLLPEEIRITAYSSSRDETDSTPFITASGERVHDGIVATNMLPLGTKIKIPSLFGDKVFTVEDRMNQRMKNVVDVWMSSKHKALHFGVAYAGILILDKNNTDDILATMVGATQRDTIKL
jgi:3D (Asp-Asp-Asp) domain-containing protein